MLLVRFHQMLFILWLEKKKIDIVVSLYHDQGLIPFKYLGIGIEANLLNQYKLRIGNTIFYQRLIRCKCYFGTRCR